MSLSTAYMSCPQNHFLSQGIKPGWLGVSCSTWLRVYRELWGICITKLKSHEASLVLIYKCFIHQKPAYDMYMYTFQGKIKYLTYILLNRLLFNVLETLSKCCNIIAKIQLSMSKWKKPNVKTHWYMYVD